MLPHALLPCISDIKLKAIKLEEGQLSLEMFADTTYAKCPVCGCISNKPHSTYIRHLLDLPWAGFQARVHLSLRKFFCNNDQCCRKIFGERLAGLHTFARKTQRFDSQLLSIGMIAGGNAGAKLATLLGMPISPSTILRILRSMEDPERPSPRVLGVDDWAIRKGHNYGTILVDLESHRPIDLLPDREADTLQLWLKQHPRIEIISRDRASAYADGAKKGAPQAIQVADRWHLLKNMVDALKRMMDKYHSASRKTAAEIAEKSKPGRQASDHESLNTKVKVDSDSLEAPLLKYQLLFQEVKKLQKKGLSIRAITHQLGMNRKTVTRYFNFDKFPERHRPPHQQFKAEPFDDYIRKRWGEGIRNYHQIFREIQQLGFDGSLVCLYKYMIKNFPNGGDNSKQVLAPKLKIYSSRRLSFLLCKKPEDLKLQERDYLENFYHHCPEAKLANGLALRFREMVTERKAHLLDGWIKDATASERQVLKNFAQSLESDYEAIKNACSMEWSNGQVEGQVNRLKNIKRQMYGRASFSLLRKRVLADTS